MIRLFFVFNGKRQMVEVPFYYARHINKRLLDQGATVYWTERC